MMVYGWSSSVMLSHSGSHATLTPSRRPDSSASVAFASESVAASVPYRTAASEASVAARADFVLATLAEG